MDGFGLGAGLAAMRFWRSCATRWSNAGVPATVKSAWAASSSSSNSVSAAASAKDSCPDSNAPSAVADSVTLAAASTVSRPTDSFLATLADETPTSSIWLMPLARWASVSALRWSLATIWCAMRSAAPGVVSSASSTYTGMVASLASRAARVRRCPSRTSMPAAVGTAVMGCSTPCSRTLARNGLSRAASSRTLSPISRVVGSRCCRVPVMITLLCLGRGPPVLFAFWHWRSRPASDAKAQRSGRGVLCSDPAGERFEKRTPRARGPVASAKAGTLRTAARRPQSEGQKAKSGHEVPSWCDSASTRGKRSVPR